jgi:hypothetical protein
MKHSILAALALALMAGNTTSASAMLVPDVQPNQECATSSIHTATNESADGFSQLSGSQARTFAKANLKTQLGAVSGVVCYICEDGGLQCTRSADVFGTITTTTPVWDPVRVGWRSTASYTGSYFVTCKVCP